MTIRVAIVNDDELVMRGLAAMLKPRDEFDLVTDLAARPAVDVVLFDPLVSGARDRTLQGLVADPHITHVVVYTWNFQPWSAGEWIGQGATGYLSKGLPSATLVEALRAIRAGRVIVAPGRYGAAQSSDWAGQDQGLTEREAQVLSLIACGMTNVEVAQHISLSVNSVKSYIRSCYRKIGVESRSQAVLWAVAHGLRGGGQHTASRSSSESA